MECHCTTYTANVIGPGEEVQRMLLTNCTFRDKTYLFLRTDWASSISDTLKQSKVVLSLWVLE